MHGVLRAARPVFAALIVSWMAGCAASNGADGVGADGSPGAVSPLSLPGARQLALSRLAHSDNGLEIRKWMVVDDADRIAAAMSAHAEVWSLDSRTQESLKRNGLRMIRVGLADVEPLLVDLGGATLDLTGWQGQAYEWFPLLERRLEAGGQALAVDGKVRRFNSGSLRLVARGWTIPTEDGPRLQLQIAPLFRPQQQAITGSFRPRLGDESPHDEVFESMAMELELESGWAYVLTCESPERQWTQSDGAGSAVESGGSGGNTPSPDETRRNESNGLGPEAAAPETAGELILRTEGHPPSRGMLVFLARIPQKLYPPAIGAEPAAKEQ